MMDSGDSEGGARGPSLKTAARCSCCCGGFVWIKCCRRNEWWSLTLRLDCELEKVSTIIIIGNLLGSILDEDDKTLFLFFRFCFYLFACFVFGRTRRLFFGLLPRFCSFLQSVFSVALFSDAWALSSSYRSCGKHVCDCCCSAKILKDEA